MFVYLVQHGVTGPEADPDRPLTEAGAEAVRRLANVASGLFAVTARSIYHSGLERARQTAAIWSALLGVSSTESDGLRSPDPPAVWAGRLAALSQDVMLVGHMPQLPKLASLLASGDEERSVVAFRQGGLVVLDGGGTDWQVCTVLPPLSVLST